MSVFQNQDAEDRFYMAKAIRLAEKGRFTAHPNPRVGCVLVNNGKIIGSGWHKRAGEPHAEVHALREAGEQARGACAYVTLEPCSHFGKTPPCADALIKAGVSRVVAAMEDPNPQVAGSGFDKLRAAGVDVVSGILFEQAAALNKGFIKRMRTGLPWVTLKVAVSLDGRTAMASGESQWITGPQARSDVQRLRAESAAVVTGISTLLCDDAALTVRAQQFDFLRFPEDVSAQTDPLFNGVSVDEVIASQPLRVVLDSQARMPEDCRLLSTPEPVLWVISDKVNLRGKQTDIAALPYVDVLPMADMGTPKALHSLLSLLAGRGINQLLVEAGSRLMGSFISAGVWDELVVYMAPKLMGAAAHPLAAITIDSMADSQMLRLKDIRQFGEDIRLIYVPSTETAA